jgi:hypothetical protein
MTDSVTSQNNDLSLWDTLYITTGQFEEAVSGDLTVVCGLHYDALSIWSYTASNGTTIDE